MYLYLESFGVVLITPYMFLRCRIPIWSLPKNCCGASLSNAEKSKNLRFLFFFPYISETDKFLWLTSPFKKYSKQNLLQMWISKFSSKMNRLRGSPGWILESCYRLEKHTSLIPKQIISLQSFSITHSDHMSRRVYFF